MSNLVEICICWLIFCGGFAAGSWDAKYGYEAGMDAAKGIKNIIGERK